MPRLIIEEGLQKGREFRFRQEARVGRGNDCLITLEDGRVSRYHARITLTPEGFQVVDEGSRNGTLVNGKRVRQAALAFGDRIGIGGAVLRFAPDPKGKWAGRVVGGYEILDRVGEGGMGTVYKALQLSLDRIVALKTLHERYAKDPKYVDKFLKEAQAAAKLNHPNIVQVLDVGSADGIYFISMELVDGQPLSEKLKGPEELAVPEVVRLARQLAEALACAHAQGIVHRDVKPENILIDEDGEAKLADLGVARMGEAVETQQRGRRTLVGTPAYMAPEEILGQPIGPYTDLYSLGTTLYHLLARRVPFIAASVPDLLRMQVYQDPPPLEEFNPLVPRRLGDTVRKLMAKDPRNRFASAEELLDALERVPSVVMPREPRRMRALGGAAAAGAAALALGYGGWELYRGTGKPREPEKRAASDGAEALGKAERLVQEGRLDEALRLLTELEEKKRDSLMGVVVSDMIQDVRKRIAERRLAALERSFGAALSETEKDPVERVKRLSSLIALADGLPLRDELERELMAAMEASRRLSDDRRQREEVRQREDQLFGALAAEVQAAVARQEFGRARAALERFSQGRPGEEWKARLAPVEAQILAAERQKYDQQRKQIDRLVEEARYGEMAMVLDAAQAWTSRSPLDKDFKDDRERWDRRIWKRVQEKEQPVQQWMDQYDYEHAAPAYDRLASEFRYTPFEAPLGEKRKAADRLGRLHKAVIGRTARADAEPFPLEDPVSRKVGQAARADPEGVMVQLSSAQRNQRPWKTIPAADVLRLYRYFLGKESVRWEEDLELFRTAYNVPK